MTLTDLDCYTFASYAREFFPDRTFAAKGPLAAYAAGIGPPPPLPEVDGYTPEQVADYLATQWVGPQTITNCLLAELVIELRRRNDRS